MDRIILVVDIETTGFLYEGGKIVEIGIVKLDLDSGEIYPAYNSLIKEPGFDDSHRKEPLGWIFRNSDLTFNEVMNAPSLESQRDIIQFLLDKYPATAYNKDFDFGFLRNRKFKINELHCPMWVADPILKIVGANKNGFFNEWPSVWECYNYFVEDNDFREMTDKCNSGRDYKYNWDSYTYKEKHRGLSDATDEAKIIYELYRLGKYNVYFPNDVKMSKTLNKDFLNSIDVLTPDIYQKILEAKIEEYFVPKLIPYRKGNKWGFCDKRGMIVIDCIYDLVEPFNNHLAKVYCNNRWGIIRENGDYLIRGLEHIKEYSEGLVAACFNGKWGYIDKNGQIAIPFKFDLCFNFSENRAAIILNDKLGFINKKGEEIIPAIYQREYTDSDFLGEPTDEKRYHFMNGKIAVQTTKGYGLIDLYGNEVIPFNYKFISDEKNGYFLFKDQYDECGFIDKNETVFFYNHVHSSIIENYFKHFNENLAAFHNSRFAWGFLDTDFKVIIDPIYHDIRSFNEGFARVKQTPSTIGYGFINRSNEFVIPCIYNDILDFSEGLAAFKESFKWGFINQNNERVISPKYTQLKSCFRNGLALVSYRDPHGYQNDRCGYIDMYGNEYWE